jgi:hypothetical protein
MHVLTSVSDSEVQQDLERLALDVMESAAVKVARRNGEELLRKSVPYPIHSESEKLFTASTEELTCFAVLQGINQNRASPNAHFVGRPPILRSGRRVPGSRGIDDNPDTVYRVIPIDGAEEYLLTGRIHRPGSPVVSDFSILSDALVTIDNLAESRLVTDEDGAFAIQVSSEAARDYPNHLKSDPVAQRQFIVVRETLGDWKTQRPCQLQIRRISSNRVDTLSREALVESAAFHVKWWFELTVKLHGMAFVHPCNFLPQPRIRSDNGMLVTQAYSIGHFNIADDQALVVALEAGNARYAAVQVSNLWGITQDAIRHTMSLNTSQANPDANTAFTFVLSVKDPGIANWIDPDGLRQGFLFLRWAAFALHDKTRPTPSVNLRVIALRDLERELPTPFVRVNAETRQTLAAAREADYMNRFDEWWQSPTG